METAMRMLRDVTAALVLAGTAAGVWAGTYSDLWLKADEPGWGVNVVQQSETAFVTLFVYGPDGRPTWYVASEAHIAAYSEPGGWPLFRGTLYRAEGAWLGGPWRAGRVIPAGELQLEVLAKDRMRVHYDADGVSGVKEVQRFSFSQPVEAANYVAQFNLRQARSGQPFGQLYLQADTLVHFDSATAQGFMRVDDQLGRRCEYRGPYQQAGKLIRFSGTFTCNSGDALAGTFAIDDLEVTANGFTGYLRAASGPHTQFGRFAALLQ
jgi:hypothetical protein